MHPSSAYHSTIQKKSKPIERTGLTLRSRHYRCKPERIVLWCLATLLIAAKGFSQITEFKLCQNDPNPFDSNGTNICYEVPVTCLNRIWVEDLQQNLVRTLVAEQQTAGSYMVFWDARDEGGAAVSPGSYVGKMVSISNGDTLFQDSISMEFQNGAHEPSFTEISVALTGVTAGAAAWGDYDQDNDVDILITGLDQFQRPVSALYRNDGSDQFTAINTDLPGVGRGQISWGDYDNDGDLDVLLSGSGVSGYLSAIYRNDGNGRFTNMDAQLTPARYSAVAWGDFDNDGDLDVLLSGYTTEGPDFNPISSIYRNETTAGSGFVNINANLAGVGIGSVAWGDYDNDGDLDIALIGDVNDSQSYTPTIKIYRNDGGGRFMDIRAPLSIASSGSVAWGDYDSDGDLDLLVSGFHLFDWNTRIYRNDGNNAFVAIPTGNLAPAHESSAAWGDYDNDGDLDIALSGYTAEGPGSPVTHIYRNNLPVGTGFTNIEADLAGVGSSSLAWGDYDNDGDLDILLTGGSVAKVYRNESVISNMPPIAPTDLTSMVSGDSVILSWKSGSDNETPASGLSYNLRVGSNPEGHQVMASHSNPATGYRYIAAIGNAQIDTQWTVKHLPDGMYYWSVQAIDNAFAGSVFASTQSFRIGTGVAVDDKPVAASIPTTFELHQNLPNPFSSKTEIRFQLPEDTHVTISVFNALGELVQTLLSSNMRVGTHVVRWDSHNSTGAQVPSGVYLYLMHTKEYVETKKMLLLK